MLDIISLLLTTSACFSILEAAPKVPVKVKLYNVFDFEKGCLAESDLADCHKRSDNDPLLKFNEFDTWQQHCTCLHDTDAAYIIDKDGNRYDADPKRSGFCRFHALILGKPNVIGNKNSDVKKEDTTVNLAQDKMQSAVIINPGIRSADFKFRCSMLTWKQTAQEITFESCADVRLQTNRINWQLIRIRRKGDVYFSADPKSVTLKFSAKVIKMKKPGLGGGPAWVIQEPTKCESELKITKPLTYRVPNEHAAGFYDSTLVTSAMGGLEKIKQALITSACRRLIDGINFAIAQQIKDEKWNLTEQKDYNPLASEGMFLQFNPEPVKID